MARFDTSTRASKMIFQSPPWPPEALFFAEFGLIISQVAKKNLACGFLHSFLFETGNPVLYFKENGNWSTLPRIRTLKT